MARQAKKRKLVKRPGLIAAANALGCTYSHLRRCLLGERQSVSLLQKYRQLKRAQRAAKPQK